MDKSKTYSLFFTTVDSDLNKQTTLGSGSFLITSDMPTNIINSDSEKKIKVGLAKIKKNEEESPDK